MTIVHQPARFYNDANSSNYYPASAGSSLESSVASKADSSALADYVASADLQGAIDGLERYALSSDIPDISGKANSADVYTKSEVDTAVGAKLDSSSLQSSIDGLNRYALASNLSNAEGNISDAQTDISNLQSYKSAVRLLALALQNQIELVNPDNSAFDWSVLIA